MVTDVAGGGAAITVGSLGLSKTLEGQGDTPDGHADIASPETLVDQHDRGEFDIAAVGRAALANPRTRRADELIPYSEREHQLTLC